MVELITMKIKMWDIFVIIAASLVFMKVYFNLVKVIESRISKLAFALSLLLHAITRRMLNFRVL